MQQKTYKAISILAIVVCVLSSASIFAQKPNPNYGYNRISGILAVGGVVGFYEPKDNYRWNDVSADTNLQAIATQARDHYDSLGTPGRGINNRGGIYYYGQDMSTARPTYNSFDMFVGIYEVWLTDSQGNNRPEEYYNKVTSYNIDLKSNIVEEGDLFICVEIRDNQFVDIMKCSPSSYSDNTLTFQGSSKPNTYFAIFVDKGALLDKEEETLPEVDTTAGLFASNDGYNFTRDEAGDITCTNAATGDLVINEFKCDGVYTYYFQADGTAMKNRLTYHPDGEHIIYLNEYGHEVFDNFAYVKQSIAGEAVDDMCYFNTFGYMYVDFLTYDITGTKLYYANPYGVAERNGWFQFSDGGFGYAQPTGHLKAGSFARDLWGRAVFLQGGNGHIATESFTNGVNYYAVDPNSGEITGVFRL